MRLAPASSAFSTSSLTTLAGRSITSPAAIWLIIVSESGRIGIAASYRDFEPAAKAGRRAAVDGRLGPTADLGAERHNAAVL